MDSGRKQSDRRILLSCYAETLTKKRFTLRNRDLNLSQGVVKISEITLHPKAEFEMVAAQSSLQFLLPLIGEIRLESGIRIEPGEIWSQFKPKNYQIRLMNPFSKESIHFLRIEIPTLNYFPETISPFLSESIKERIHPIFTHRHQGEYFRISLGNLSGRTDVEFPTLAASLALIISGVLEFQHCLLEEGDCLWVEKESALEMEALSPEALIMILEITLQ